MQVKHIRFLVLALLTGASARAQPAPDATALSPGIVRQGNIITMQPVARPDEAPAAPAITTRPSNLHVLSETDHDIFARAFDAAAHGDWTAARTIAIQGQDPTAKKLFEWRYLLNSASSASFPEIDAFLKGGDDWPLRRTLLIRAEQAIPPEMTNDAVIQWFGARDPLTGEGRIRLGEALVAVGKTDTGRDLIRRGWIGGSFDAATELVIEQRDGSFFTPQIEDQRLDSLIWRDEITAARRQIARASPSGRAIARARIALRTSLAAARDPLAALPADAQSDPSLLFDRAAAERHDSNDDAAHQLLLKVDAGPMLAEHEARWWEESNAEARDALDAGDAATAAAIVEHAGLTAGDDFADAEFLAGFIALEFLKEPKPALVHFQKLDANVSRPISKARAQYWEGRAYEAMDNKPDAWRQYNLAATAPETFYGQLAAARINASPVLHLADTAVDAAPESALGADALIAPMRVLVDLGQENLLRLFAERDDVLDPSPSHVKRLILDFTDWGYREIAVRLAKNASYAGTEMPDYTYPVIPIPAYAGPGTAPDAALVLGVIRQETDLDPYAVSSAGARGLMQVMTFTAHKSAQLAGVPYRAGDLLSDTAYNMQLGMIELAGHIKDWNGSLVLALAAYNAGSTNARRWIKLNGDPATIDPVDWIERIPFGETRNYVQRVLENTEVYRNRLTGRDAALRILADLYTPNPPPATQLDYTPPVAALPAPAPRPN